MNIVDIAQKRHSCKAYDATQRLSPEQVAALCALLRSAPSSVNSQPWHFVVAASEAGKQRVAQSATGGFFAANIDKITRASHVFVLCARSGIDEAYLAELLAQEESDGRFRIPEGKVMQDKGRRFYFGLHRDNPDDLRSWIEKQVYLALGSLLLGAAALGIDATPIEGFDQLQLDAELGLTAKGYRSVVLVAFGQRSAEDFNADLPKSRLPAKQLFSEI